MDLHLKRVLTLKSAVNNKLRNIIWLYNLFMEHIVALNQDLQ